LRKRENFRAAFAGFAPEKVARFGARDVNRLLKNDGIIRSRAKIEAAIRAAKLWLEIEEKEAGGFSDLIWKHVDGRPQINRFKSMGQIPARTEMSEALSKDLKQRGFNFCGPLIVYAFAQATGMVNDHIVSCFRHAQCARMAKE
jgi:DNA-3-methyladenine glycosylase I